MLKAVYVLALATLATASPWGAHSNPLAKRAATGTGCLCKTFYWGKVVNGVQINQVSCRVSGTELMEQPLMKASDSVTTNPDGWCFVNSQMTAIGVQRVRDAVLNNIDSPYANGPLISEWCQALSAPPGADACATFMVSRYTVWIEGAMTACTYPTAGTFVPLSCTTCAFQCNAPLVACGTSCIDPSLQTCNSGVPARKRNTLAQCQTGLTACQLRYGWECVDTQTDLESCGGCPSQETDCSALSGAWDVQCVAGQCVIHTCAEGLSLVNNECV